MTLILPMRWPRVPGCRHWWLILQGGSGGRGQRICFYRHYYYTCFFLKTGLLKNVSLSHWLLIWWPLFGLKSKISPQKEIIEYMSFHLIESSVLKVTKVKFSSLIWKIRHFKKQFLVFNNMTLSLTEAPLKNISWANGGNSPSLRAGLLPPSWKFSGICTDFCQCQEVIWSPWLRGEGG